MKRGVVMGKSTGERMQFEGFEYHVNGSGTVSIDDFDLYAEEARIPAMINGLKVTTIEEAFADKSDLLSIEIPATVTTIKKDAFSCSPNLAHITVSQQNERYEVIDNVLFDKKAKELVLYPPGLEEAEYSIPEGILSIGDSAFEGCQSLERIEIPQSVRTINDWAFGDCSCLESIDIPDKVSFIGNNVFAGCMCLRNITVSPDNEDYAAIDNVLFNKKEKELVLFLDRLHETEYIVPKGIVSIGENAFGFCSNLVGIDLPVSLTTIKAKAFERCKNLKHIKISECVVTIGNEAFRGCSSLAEISVSPDNEHFAAINNVLFNKKDKELLLYPQGLSAREYIVPKGIVSIADEAFHSCINLFSVELPNTVTKIKSFAFQGCDNLKRIRIPDSVKEIDFWALSGCQEALMIVDRNSYAADFVKKNKYNYTYPDANDWLNS